MKAFLLHHRDDLGWVRLLHGPDARVIAHEDYLPALLDEAMPCFFAHGSCAVDTDEAINFLSHNWYRDEDGRDVCTDGVLSIAEAFSAGLWITVAGVCREYFALKYWCERFEYVHVSCNEYSRFLQAAGKFGDRVRIYDPGHRHPSPLRSQVERVLDAAPLAGRRSNVLRLLQAPFLCLLRNRTLALANWTVMDYAAWQQGWISEYSGWPWRGAYPRKPPGKYLAEAERRVPVDFHAQFSPVQLAGILRRINVRWDDGLIELLSETMVDRYRRYRDYFVAVVALYLDMLDSYRPAELVVPSEFYEPYLVAAQLARETGAKISWLFDGYPVVDLNRRIGRATLGPAMFDRIYAVGSQHQSRLLVNKPQSQEIVTVFPPVLHRHELPKNAEKRFDAIIMTWIPYDLGNEGRNGSRPTTLLDALRAATEAGLRKLAIKIKDRSEKEWLLPVLEKSGYLGSVTILEGPFSGHVAHARRVIGGISSAVGETAYHGIPYYIYEPVANGYSAEQLATAVVIREGGVARTPDELRDLLQRPGGSVTGDREMLFGTQSRNAEWSWDQTREIYTDWAASWADQSGIKKTLSWRGFPLWWASTLIAKDTGVDYAWYQELHNRLRGLPAERFELRSAASVYAGILKSLARDLAQWLLLKWLPAAARPDGERIWFHSLEYNLMDPGEGFCDRMYERAYLDDRKYGFVSAFMIRLNSGKADLLHPWSWRRRIARLAEKLQRDVEFLDRYYSLRDVIGIHLCLAKNYSMLSKFIEPLCRQGVRIGHAEFADILLAELQKSFVAYLPWSLSYAAMFQRWLQRNGGAKVQVTYGETLAWMRPVYFATRRHSPGHKWISIQHATIYKNKMGFYHRHSEFNHSGSEDKRPISPKPDYYFVHGRQYANILAEFYPPENIRTIGCLKYDRLHRMYGGRPQTVRGRGTNRMLLLAPSVGDEEIILRMFSGLRELAGWKVVLSRHPTVSQERIRQIVDQNDIALTIEFDPSKSTIQLIEDASLVICSYSGMALESYFLGVPSVRVLNPKQPPMVENEPGIRYVTTQQDLLSVISALDECDFASAVTPEVSGTLDYYFFRFDGLASQRFWTQLRQLPDLPGRPMTES